MTEYDYVVVGAGSAGCVMASRLIEGPSVRVLLLEAGGSDRNLNIRTVNSYRRSDGSTGPVTFSSREFSIAPGVRGAKINVRVSEAGRKLAEKPGGERISVIADVNFGDSDRTYRYTKTLRARR